MEKNSYNLVDEEFLPCLFLDGTFKKLNLRDFYEQAHQVRDVCVDAPINRFALIRFLVALTSSIYQIENKSDLGDLIDEELFDIKVFDKYMSLHKNSFDLFDDKNPFYQDISLDSLDSDRLSKRLKKVFFISRPQKDSSVFNKTFDEHDNTMYWDDFVINLIRFQTISLMSPRGSGPVSEYTQMISPYYFIDEPLFQIQGNNMFITISSQIVPSSKHDRPTWEFEDKDPWNNSEKPLEYRQYYTLNRSKIRIKDFDDHGVRSVYCIGKEIYKESGVLFKEYKDPMVSSQKMRYSCDKAFWRQEFFVDDLKNLSNVPIISNIPRNSIDGRIEVILYQFVTKQKTAIALQKTLKGSIPLDDKDSKKFFDIVSLINKNIDKSIDKLKKYIGSTFKLQAAGNRKLAGNKKHYYSQLLSSEFDRYINQKVSELNQLNTGEIRDFENNEENIKNIELEIYKKYKQVVTQYEKDNFKNLNYLKMEGK